MEKLHINLVIAEKPSVAMSIAKVLGAGSRKDGYMEGGGWLVSWCVGHLVQMAPADTYDPRYSKWSYDDLPIIPDPWQFQVLPDTRKQFNILRQLMNRDDVETVICATDAGREGELIFRLTYDLCKCTKPIKRLWISSMEESAIRKGFENLCDSGKYDNLYAAALCRAKADWLIGINGTRLFTTLYKGKTPSTYEGHKSLIDNYIRPLIGDRKLDDINPRMMDHFYKQLKTVKAKARPYGVAMIKSLAQVM